MNSRSLERFGLQKLAEDEIHRDCDRTILGNQFMSESSDLPSAFLILVPAMWRGCRINVPCRRTTLDELAYVFKLLVMIGWRRAMSTGLKNWLRRAPWRIRRILGNVAYRLRLIRAPGAAGFKPSWFIIFIVVVGLAVFFLAGGIYDLLEKPVSLLPRSGQQGYTFIYPGGIGGQTLNESILSALLYVIGLAGLYLSLIHI